VSTFFYPMTVRGPNGDLTVDALVDTGATFSSLPAATLEQLGVRPRRVVRLRLADGSTHEQRVGPVEIGLNGESDVMPIMFGEAQSPPSIGAITLEILQLGVDPVAETLKPIVGWQA
jgi:predicted aspartyl protease